MATGQRVCYTRSSQEKGAHRATGATQGSSSVGQEAEGEREAVSRGFSVVSTERNRGGRGSRLRIG